MPICSPDRGERARQPAPKFFRKQSTAFLRRMEIRAARVKFAAELTADPFWILSRSMPRATTAWIISGCCAKRRILHPQMPNTGYISLTKCICSRSLHSMRFLKTLEEPPAHVIFILATTEVHKLPATILSRCQRFDFRRIPPKEIADRLTYIAEQEHVKLELPAAMLIARLADGALRDALSILDQCIGVSDCVTEETVRKNGRAGWPGSPVCAGG